MSEKTATRMRVAARIASFAVLAAAWLYAASLLWRTQLPAHLRLPRLDPHRVFSDALLRRTARHDGFLRIDFLLASAAQLVGLVVLAVRAPRLVGRLRGGALLRGLQLALVALVVSWLARFPFGLAAEWWERRHGISRQSYGAWLVGRLPSPGSVAALLALVAGGMLLARWLGRSWWVGAGPVLAAGALLLALVQPLLGPTLHPLRDRQLVAVLAGSGIRVGVERVAKETRSANAEAIGIGPTRRIVFTDTILRGPFGAPELRFAARRLSVASPRVALEQPNPPRWSQLLLDDHPTLLRRIAMAQAWAARDR